ncbi:hypothetical protein DPEC_G00251750 [Dallia pectoralis]|uniref:Uncharacterized protein n=1 Tax=Dallia pectoralis TaxID=75939 RepID=A0ACC2FTH9_DALPE|nr:hypothetical protein DPEC_G00251750 [Dallia pectoralis]
MIGRRFSPGRLLSAPRTVKPLGETPARSLLQHDDSRLSRAVYHANTEGAGRVPGNSCRYNEAFHGGQLSACPRRRTEKTRVEGGPLVKDKAPDYRLLTVHTHTSPSMCGSGLGLL